MVFGVTSFSGKLCVPVGLTLFSLSVSTISTSAASRSFRQLLGGGSAVLHQETRLGPSGGPQLIAVHRIVSNYGW